MDNTSNTNAAAWAYVALAITWERMGQILRSLPANPAPSVASPSPAPSPAPSPSPSQAPSPSVPSGSYARLRSGDWGVRLPLVAPLPAGTQVEIRKRSGERKTETLGDLVYTGRDFSLYEIQRRRRRRQYRGGDYCGGICPVGGFRCSPENGPCHDCE